MQPRKQPTNGDNGNGGSLVNFRLGELERRMGVMEDNLKTLTTLCTQINTRLDGMATGSFVWKAFGVSGGVAVLTLVAHVALRFIGAD